MKEMILLGKNTYTRKEMSKAVLFGKANPKDFVYSFTFHGVDLFVKVG